LEGNLEKAFSVYKKSLELQLQIDDKLGMGYSYINLGDVMKKKGDFKAALNYYEISKKIREEIKDYQGLSQIYLHEGDLFLSNNRKKDAELSYLKGMEIAKKISYPELIRDASEKLYLNYKKIGNNKLAFEYYETFIIMRDSINNIETQKATIKQQTQYEFDKQQAIQKEKHDAEIKLQNEKAEADKKKQNIIIVSVSLVLIIVAVFSLLLYKRFKTTQQQKIIIEKKEKETQAQKHLVEEKQKEILDSINYAKRLQEAILPPLDYINEHLPNNFVLYQPKDVVAGDFYWAEMKDDKFFIAAADCTGHGVPGAMVSVVCSNALNRTVNEFGITNTGNILDKTRELVLETFAKGNAEVKDGMDISLLCIDKKNNKAFWSGANNPLWYVDPVTSSTPHSVTSSEVEKSTAPGLDSARPDNKTFNSIENNITSSTQHSVTSSTPHSVTSSTQHSVTSSEVEKSTASGLDSSRPDIKEIKADKQPIGKTDNPKPFTTHEIELKPGMQFYLFTDGFADQFGGPKGKKFKYKQLEELLLTYSNLTMQEQQQHLFDKFSEWKGDLEQVDDVCVIGVKV
jgi:serine phosphatase RsbU (regulator of sigma subunit)